MPIVAASLGAFLSYAACRESPTVGVFHWDSRRLQTLPICGRFRGEREAMGSHCSVGVHILSSCLHRTLTAPGSN